MCLFQNLYVHPKNDSQKNCQSFKNKNKNKEMIIHQLSRCFEKLVQVNFLGTIIRISTKQ